MALRTSAIAVVFDEAERIFLLRQSYWKRFYALPGGLVEEDEAPHDAVLREIQEEVGVRGRVESLLGVYDVSYPGFPRTVVYVFHCFIEGTPRVAQPEEIESVGWFDIENLPQPLGPLMPSILEDWGKGLRGVVRAIDF